MFNDDDDIREYLFVNSSWHAEGKDRGMHSWPCGLWYNLKDDLSWWLLASHGFLPRNFKLLTLDKEIYGEEKERRKFY